MTLGGITVDVNRGPCQEKVPQRLSGSPPLASTHTFRNVRVSAAHEEDFGLRRRRRLSSVLQCEDRRSAAAPGGGIQPEHPAAFRGVLSG